MHVQYMGSELRERHLHARLLRSEREGKGKGEAGGEERLRRG